MGMGTSIFLIAIGAILAFAVKIEPSSGISLDTVGIILLIVGALGAVLSMIFWSSWGGFGGTRVVEGRSTGRRTVVEEEI